MKSFKDISKSDFKASDFNFLVVTATEVETNAFHEVMPDEIVRIVSDGHTYYMGKVGLYNVVHVQCLQMGSLNTGGSAQTIHAALTDWPQIKAVIMMGICFGFDKSKQHIGDVVAATSIKNYETRRVGKKNDIPRGATYQANSCLVNAFNNLKHTWEYIGTDNKKKSLVLGECVSGEQLVDNEDARNKLKAETPEAKAGEMEGNGLASSCESLKKPWILVKSICDFADGNKGRGKKKKQAIAAASSAHCCAAVLEQATAFESIGIHAAESNRNDAVATKEENMDVLFEIYRGEFAQYYLRREIDKLVESYLLNHSLWIYGESGTGKSTSILNALHTMGKERIIVNMAGINPNSSLDEIFKWIHTDVANVVGESFIAPPNHHLCIRSIISLLDKHYADKEVYVLVEEIPFTGDAWKDFIASFSSLVVSDKLTGQSASVHFVLSSIDNPLPLIPDYLQKIKSMVKFLQFSQWTNEECIALIDLIRKYITIPKIKDTAALISQCSNLPRPIKQVFREAYQTGFKGDLDSSSVSMLLR